MDLWERNHSGDALGQMCDLRFEVLFREQLVHIRELPPCLLVVVNYFGEGVCSLPVAVVQQQDLVAASPCLTS